MSYWQHVSQNILGDAQRNQGLPQWCCQNLWNTSQNRSKQWVTKQREQVKQGNRKTACKSQSMLSLTTLHERTDAMALWCYQSLLICLILHFLLCNLQARTLKDFCIRGRIPSLSYWYFLIVSYVSCLRDTFSLLVTLEAHENDIRNQGRSIPWAASCVFV